MNHFDKMVLVCALDSAIASEEKLLVALSETRDTKKEREQSSLLLSHYKRLRREMYVPKAPQQRGGVVVLAASVGALLP